MTKVFFRRTFIGLEPDDEMAQDALRGVTFGAVVAVEITRPRNLQHHRLYWALCTKIANAIDVTPENVSDVLKIATGHFTTVRGKTDTYRLPKSISFAKMDQAEFNAFFDRCCRVICEQWVNHMKAEALRDDVLRMVGVPVAA